ITLRLNCAATLYRHPLQTATAPGEQADAGAWAKPLDANPCASLVRRDAACSRHFHDRFSDLAVGGRTRRISGLENGAAFIRSPTRYLLGCHRIKTACTAAKAFRQSPVRCGRIRDEFPSQIQRPESIRGARQEIQSVP